MTLSSFKPFDAMKFSSRWKLLCNSTSDIIEEKKQVKFFYLLFIPLIFILIIDNNITTSNLRIFKWLKTLAFSTERPTVSQSTTRKSGEWICVFPWYHALSHLIKSLKNDMNRNLNNSNEFIFFVWVASNIIRCFGYPKSINSNSQSFDFKNTMSFGIFSVSINRVLPSSHFS